MTRIQEEGDVYRAATNAFLAASETVGEDNPIGK
jgi:hypothetical protein